METNDGLIPPADVVSPLDSACVDGPDRVVQPLPLWFELVAVFCLAVLQPLAGAIHSVLSPRVETTSLVTSCITWIPASVQVMIPLLFLLRLQRVDWREFGFQPVRWALDPLLAVLFYFLTVGGYSVAYYVPALLGFDGVYDLDWDYSMSASQSQPWFLVVGLVVVASAANGFTEELVMRSYFITRLKQLGWSSMHCIMATSLCFAAYHVYQGILATMGMFIMGILFGAYFSAERRLWPLVLAHTILDADALLRTV